MAVLEAVEPVDQLLLMSQVHLAKVLERNLSAPLAACGRYFLRVSSHIETVTGSQFS